MACPNSGSEWRGLPEGIDIRDVDDAKEGSKRVFGFERQVGVSSRTEGVKPKQRGVHDRISRKGGDEEGELKRRRGK